MMPYLMKFSMMTRRLSTRNMMPARLMNPRNRCVGDSPLKMEICLTLLGTKARQLLYLWFLSMDSLISAMAVLLDLMQAMGICS